MSACVWVNRGVEADKEDCQVKPYRKRGGPLQHVIEKKPGGSTDRQASQVRTLPDKHVCFWNFELRGL